MPRLKGLGHPIHFPSSLQRVWRGIGRRGDWDLTRIRPSGKVENRSSLLAEFTIIIQKCVNHSFESRQQLGVFSSRPYVA